MAILQRENSASPDVLTLTELANRYASDKGTVAPQQGNHGPRLGFTEVYSKYFEPVRRLPIKLLEIGIGSGPSLRMWYDYFPFAKIYAIDIVPCRQYDNDKVSTFVADQAQPETLRRIASSIGGIDIIVDDGSHVCEHQQTSLSALFPFLNPGGQYWVEDLHTSDTSVWTEGKTLYGNDMSKNVGDQNTVTVFERFESVGTFFSPFLTTTENQLLTQTIGACKVFDLGITEWGRNKLALFRRRL
jgi:23S rRNA U2552 (ribose-2'-O)-methylase RlmE/FtsJ